MTQDEIDTMWQQAMRQSIQQGEMFTRYSFAKLVAEKALAEKSMREVQRLGQEIEPVTDDIASILACRDMLDAQPVPPRTEQEPVAWPCHIIEADFSERTITLGMECGDYKVSAGTHWLSTAPPKQKPVAWMLDGEFYKTQQFHLQGGPYANQIPLYTTPPQRTWVGLTEQEHTDIAVECGCMSADWVFYGAAVERKVKEKNT